MPLAQKCILLPIERYEMLMKSFNAPNKDTSEAEITSTPPLLPPSPIEEVNDPNDANNETQASQNEKPQLTLIGQGNLEEKPKLPPPGLPDQGRKRKLQSEIKPVKKKRKTWKDIWMPT